MPQWTEDELILVLEFYYQCPENTHTDSHPMCQEVAALTSHTAKALDLVLRNTKFADQGTAGLPHVAQRLRGLVEKYKNNRSALLREAARIRSENGWAPLRCHD